MTAVNITNKRIVLRALEPEDVEVLYQWENDQSIWHLSNTITPFSKHILAKYIDSAHLDIYQTKQLRLVIETTIAHSHHVKNPIGAIDLFDFEPYHNRAGIGILIGEKNARGKGLAFEALECLINYAFGNLQLHQLYCNILSNNHLSIQLFQKAGFTQIGIKKDWIKIGNYYHNEIIFQLINSNEK